MKVQHAFHKANSYADALANIGCSMVLNMMVYESYSTQIMHLLVTNQPGATLHRQVKL